VSDPIWAEGKAGRKQGGSGKSGREKSRGGEKKKVDKVPSRTSGGQEKKGGGEWVSQIGGIETTKKRTGEGRGVPRA